METFVDETKIIQELYCRMKNNSDLAGSFELNGGKIDWKLFDGYDVEIASEYIGISRQLKLIKPLYTSIFHWHPDDEDLYTEVCKLGTKGNVTVIHMGWVWSCLLYSGPRSYCPIKRKWLFGKYIYLDAV